MQRRKPLSDGSVNGLQGTPHTRQVRLNKGGSRQVGIQDACINVKTWVAKAKPPQPREQKHRKRSSTTPTVPVSRLTLACRITHIAAPSHAGPLTTAGLPRCVASWPTVRRCVTTGRHLQTAAPLFSCLSRLTRSLAPTRQTGLRIPPACLIFWCKGHVCGQPG